MRVLSLLLLASFASAASAGAHGVERQCARLLGGFAASGHSDVDLAAYCRASYPTGMCRLMRESLGNQPWASSRISATCGVLDKEVREADLALPTERRMMSYDEFEQTLEASANQKAQFGYNLPRHQDGTIDMDRSVQMKFEQTQTMIRAYNQYMGYETEKTAADQQKGGRFNVRQQKWEESYVSGAGGQSFAAMAAFGALSLATMGMVGGVVLLARRMPHRRTVALLPSKGVEQPSSPGHMAAEAGGDLE